jgi:hypothetical protein
MMALDAGFQRQLCHCGLANVLSKFDRVNQGPQRDVEFAPGESRKTHLGRTQSPLIKLSQYGSADEALVQSPHPRR